MAVNPHLYLKLNRSPAERPERAERIVRMRTAHGPRTMRWARPPKGRASFR
jgi:hypothetical protein